MFDIQTRAAVGGPKPVDEIQMFVPDEVLGRMVTRSVGAVPNDAGPFNGAVVHLFQNPMTATQSSVLGDFVECNFTGYAASANLTFATGLDDEGNHVAVGNVAPSFTCTGDPAGQVVHGAYLTDHNATPRLVAAGTLAEPITLVNGQVIPFTATLQIGNS